jgi:hypothetical protein
MVCYRIDYSYYGRLSTTHALTELEQIQVLNELSEENIGEYSLDDESVFGSNYRQLVTPGTHVISDMRVIMIVMNNNKM